MCLQLEIDRRLPLPRQGCSFLTWIDRVTVDAPEFLSCHESLLRARTELNRINPSLWDRNTDSEKKSGWRFPTWNGVLFLLPSESEIEIYQEGNLVVSQRLSCQWVSTSKTQRTKRTRTQRVEGFPAAAIKAPFLHHKFHHYDFKFFTVSSNRIWALGPEIWFLRLWNQDVPLYICICIWVYVCMCIHVSISVYVNVSIYVYTYVYICIHV